MKEAMFYDIVKKEGFENSVNCKLCPHNCFIKNNEYGFCGVRKNVEGKLYSLVYNKPVSINIDPIEKKPLYHFLPGSSALSVGTFGCNLSCLNCQNFEISSVRKGIAEKELGFIRNVEPEEIVESAKKRNCESISYTYNEPTVFYEYAFEIMKIARRNGLKNVFVSNGYINEEPLRKLIPYLNAINVDLKFFNEEKYSKITSGSLKHVLKTLEILNEENVWTEITNLLIPDLNDESEEIEEMVSWISKTFKKKAVLHFSRFFPMYRMVDKEVTPAKSLLNAYEIAVKKLNFVYIGNIYLQNKSNTYCHNCKRLLIEREGFNILENNIISGKCKFCEEKIHGIWE
jgi:pyruvate formate lyase activating enzyme